MMMNGCSSKNNKVFSRNIIVKETQLGKLISKDNCGIDHNLGETNILTEQDFETTITEAKELVNIVIKQNNTSETRKLKRRLWRIEKAWEALMRWIHSIKDVSSEEEHESEEQNQVEKDYGFDEIVKGLIPDPFIMIMLLGLPKNLKSSVLLEEIYHNIDCGQLSFHQLSRTYRKYEMNISCVDGDKDNWVIRLPYFVGKRILDAKNVTIQKQVVLAKEFIELIQCYKCWRFGHYSGQCQRATRCKLCAGFHLHSSCTAEVRRCVNCTDQGFKEADTLHTATSNHCPVRRNYFGSSISIPHKVKDSCDTFGTVEE